MDINRIILKKGIDVSKHQQAINWTKVKNSGVDFAIIRIGYRGYSNGQICADTYFRKNIAGALSVGIEVGGYFYSTALNEKEAIEDANYCIEMLKDYNVTFPLVFDFEGYEEPKYRTYGITKEQRTACCNAFINTISASGYTTMLYGSKGNIRTTYDLDKLNYPLWIARYAGEYKKILSDDKYFPDVPKYSDRIAMWQYTSIGKVDGINGNVDMNYMYIDVSKTETAVVEKEENPMVKPVDYKQGDYKWGSLKYAVDGESSTIKSAGCGTTTMANVLASLVSPYIDPVTTSSWSRMKGYKVKNSGTSYNYFVAQGKEYGVKIERLNTVNIYNNPTHSIHSKALAALKNGNWIIACMGKGNWTSGGHYILVYGYENGQVYINDPASTKANRACNTWDLFKSQVKYYWSVEVPETFRKNGIVTDGEYRFKDFVREVQYVLGAGIDGVPGNQTLSKTITVSPTKNRKHEIVYVLQKRFKKLGYYTGKLDCVAGKMFGDAVDLYQKIKLNYDKLDKEVTAKGKMWRSLLGL